MGPGTFVVRGPIVDPNSFSVTGPGSAVVPALVGQWRAGM